MWFMCDWLGREQYIFCWQSESLLCWTMCNWCRPMNVVTTTHDCCKSSCRFLDRVTLSSFVWFDNNKRSICAPPADPGQRTVGKTECTLWACQKIWICWPQRMLYLQKHDGRERKWLLPCAGFEMASPNLFFLMKFIILNRFVRFCEMFLKTLKYNTLYP